MTRLAGAIALFALSACGNGTKTTGSSDMAMKSTMSGPDMMLPGCVMNPMTGTELLNGCTTSQTGDPKKDAPYYPTLAPNGNLPPLP